MVKKSKLPTEVGFMASGEAGTGHFPVFFFAAVVSAGRGRSCDLPEVSQLISVRLIFFSPSTSSLHNPMPSIKGKEKATSVKADDTIEDANSHG